MTGDCRTPPLDLEKIYMELELRHISEPKYMVLEVNEIESACEVEEIARKKLSMSQQSSILS